MNNKKRPKPLGQEIPVIPIYSWEDCLNDRCTLLNSDTDFRREKSQDTNSEKFKNILNTAAKSEHFGAGFDNHLTFKMDGDTYVMRVELHLDKTSGILYVLKLIKILPNYFAKATNPDLHVTSFVISSDEAIEYLRFKEAVEEYIRLKQANNREIVISKMRGVDGERNTEM